MPFINKTWTLNDAPTASQFNTHIRDNFDALKNLPHQLRRLSRSPNLTTSSLTPVVVDSIVFVVTVTPTITSGTCSIDVWGNFNLRCSNSATAQVVKFRIDVDGAPTTLGSVANFAIEGNNTVVFPVNFYYRITGLSASAHIINLAWWTTGNTATIFTDPADARHAEGQFGAKESS
ncbi:MAG: hypothetical protein MUF38_06445 [Anaerolineae bacterium]|jgi:hypothetical protein|nr:hypothetical protein [Anaerolineae bacterium]